jgi:hypothetical protein
MCVPFTIADFHCSDFLSREAATRTVAGETAPTRILDDEPQYVDIGEPAESPL